MGMVDGFQRQAAKAAISAGVPAESVDALWAWAAEAMPFEQRTAASALVLGP